MYAMMIVMGFMIIVISFIIGYINSQTAAAYFAESKLVRETTLMAERAALESVGLWLPYFKFLGLGFLLSGIVMALRVIIDNLRGVGDEVLLQVEKSVRPKAPSPPWYAMMMPMLMMLGLIIFIIAFILALQNAALARDVFSNAVPDIDTAAGGSNILISLTAIKSSSAWLIPLKFFAIATEFLAIAIGLSTIVYILTAQTEVLDEAISKSKGGASS
jgi:hypothetical protein